MDSKILFLDEDELEEAKFNKVITEEDYKLAIDTKKELKIFYLKKIIE